MKLKLKTTILLLCCCFSAFAKESKTQLVVWAKDGTHVAFALAEKPKVTFTGTNLTITAKDVEVSYTLENMYHLTYEDEMSMAVTDLLTNRLTFAFDGEFLLFPDLKANSTISIYSNGLPVFQKIVQRNGEYAFSLSNLAAGVYIISVNGLTQKILKR